MIGYYVHHHGAGHARRLAAVRGLIADEVVGLGSGPKPSDVPPSAWVALAHDATRQPADDPTAGDVLHWAPLGEPGLRTRTAQLAAWAEEHRPRGLVVDVSVEVALTARLLGLPTVVIAQHGDRTDPPHRLAYASATLVAALWHPGQHPDPPGARRVVHVGPLSRFDGRIGEAASPSSPERSGGRRRVTVLLGTGGHALSAEQLRAAAAATDQHWSWDVIGDDRLGRRVDDAGELWAALRAADVVVAPASNNCVGEVAAARRPLIALPQARPFAEQQRHAEVLTREGLATAVDAWPEPDRWPALLDDAARRGGTPWQTHHDGFGARRLAEAIGAALA